MQFQNLLEYLFKLFTDIDGCAFLLDAACVCLLVEITKNCILNKLKIDLTKKFDPTVLLPFGFGLIIAILEAVFIKKMSFEGAKTVYSVAIDGLSIGATAVVIYRAFSALNKSNIKTLCKDGVFDILYNEIMIVSDVKQKLLDKQITLKEFVAKLSAAVSGIKAVYGEDIDLIDFEQCSQSEPEVDEAKQNVALAENVTDNAIINSLNKETMDCIPIDTAVESDKESGLKEKCKMERSDEQKQECLKTLLSGFVDDDNLTQLSVVLHKAFKQFFSTK